MKSIISDHNLFVKSERTARADDSRVPTSTRQCVRDAIQDRILKGQLMPGQRLTQIELAKEFGVAQTVVREALLELGSSGLVRLADQVGAFVSDLDAATILEAFEIREGFEGLAARLCCQRANRQDHLELEHIIGRIRQAGRAGEAQEMGRLDRQFHLRTIRISGHQLLQRLTGNYWLLGMMVRAEREIETVYREHRSIVGAIQAGNAEDAESLARGHVRAGRRAVQQMIDEGRFKLHWVTASPEKDI